MTMNRENLDEGLLSELRTLATTTTEPKNFLPCV